MRAQKTSQTLRAMLKSEGYGHTYAAAEMGDLKAFRQVDRSNADRPYPGTVCSGRY